MMTRMMLAQAMSPIHCGTGRAVGGIDLPIAREVPTTLPIIPGSTLKGVLRAGDSTDSPLHTVVFGPDTDHASEHAGSVQFSDLTLGFLPVRSLYGTFSWVTSPFILRRFMRDADQVALGIRTEIPEPGPRQALVAADRLVSHDRIVFEDLDFDAVLNEAFKNFVEAFASLLYPGGRAESDRTLFIERASMIHDDVMGLLLQSSMAITTRVRIDPDSGTVARGALWTEEALPVESVLFGLVVATPVRYGKGGSPDPGKLMTHVSDLTAQPAQLGSGATIGRGLCRLSLVGGIENANA